MPEELVFPHRAGHKNLRSDQLWAEMSIWEVERNALQKYLQGAARLEEDDAGVFGHGLTTYITGATPPSPALIAADFQNDAPRPATILRWKTLKWGAILLETAVISLQAVFAIGTGLLDVGILVFLAGLLALGGILQGRYLADWSFGRWAARKGYPFEADPSVTIAITGTLLILAVATFRAIGAGFSSSSGIIAWVITVLLGEAVALCEAKERDYSERRENLLDVYLKIQQYRASKKHGSELTNYITAYADAISGRSRYGGDRAVAEQEIRKIPHMKALLETNSSSPKA